MDVSKLDCPGCGAFLKEVNGIAVCEFCGREVIIESKIIENMRDGSLGCELKGDI